MLHAVRRNEPRDCGARPLDGSPTCSSRARAPTRGRLHRAVSQPASAAPRDRLVARVTTRHAGADPERVEVRLGSGRPRGAQLAHRRAAARRFGARPREGCRQGFRPGRARSGRPADPGSRGRSRPARGPGCSPTWSVRRGSAGRRADPGRRRRGPRGGASRSRNRPCTSRSRRSTAGPGASRRRRGWSRARLGRARRRRHCRRSTGRSDGRGRPESRAGRPGRRPGCRADEPAISRACRPRDPLAATASAVGRASSTGGRPPVRTKSAGPSGCMVAMAAGGTSFRVPRGTAASPYPPAMTTTVELIHAGTRGDHVGSSTSLSATAADRRRPGPGRPQG